MVGVEHVLETIRGFVIPLQIPTPNSAPINMLVFLKPQTLGAHRIGAHPLYDFNTKLQ
jgi:hypothetical protein